MKYFRAFILVFFIALGLSAQEKKVIFNNLSVDNLLPSNDVNFIKQDKFGFIWVGMRGGLCKYDGKKVKIYGSGINENSLPSDDIINGCVLNNGDFIIATSNGLARYFHATDRIKQYVSNNTDTNSLLENFIPQVVVAKGGKVWLRHFNGISIYDPKTEKFERLGPNLGGKSYLNISQIFTLHLTPDSGIIIRDYKKGIFVQKEDQFKLMPLNYEVQKLLYIDDLRNVILMGNKFIYWNMDDPAYKIHEIKLDNSEDYKIIAYTVDGQKRIWVAASASVFVVDIHRGKVDHISHDKYPELKKYKSYESISYIKGQGVFAFSSNQAMCLFDTITCKPRLFIPDISDPLSFKAYGSIIHIDFLHDKGKVNWISTPDKGLMYFDLNKTKFPLIQNSALVQNSIKNTTIRGIASIDKRFVWIGNNLGLNLYDRKTNEFTLFQTNFTGINNIQIFNDNEIWVAHLGLTVFQFDSIQKKIKKVWEVFPENGHPEVLPGWYVTRIYKDPRGVIWVGASGLGKFIPEKKGNSMGYFTCYFQDASNPKSLLNNTLWDILRDHDNNLWITTSSGLSCLDIEKNTFTNYKNDKNDMHSLSTDNVKCLLEDSKKNIWIGTEGGGFCRFNKKERNFERFDQTHGLPSTTIYGMYEDQNGIIWMSSKNGIIQFDPQKVSFTQYGVADGVQAMEYNIQSYNYNPATKEILFGGSKGVNIFDPLKVKSSQYVPNLVISYLMINNRPVEVSFGSNKTPLTKPIWETEQIQLKYTQNSLYFEYASLDFSSPDIIRYKYILEGFDKEWIIPDAKNNSANYTNLDPGKYIFRVKATNSDGIWNVPERKLYIFIAPPFWETWWFRIIVLLTLVSSVVSYLRYKTYAMKKRNELLETLVNQRTQEVMQQKEEIQQQAEELEATNEELTAQSDALKMSNEELNEKNNEIQKSFSNAQTISEFGKSVTSTFDLDSINEIAHFYVNSMMSADAFGVGIYNEKENQIEYIGFIEAGQKLDKFTKKLDTENSLSAWCFNNQQSVFINDLDKEYSKYIPNLPNISTQQKPKSLIHLPLSIMERRIGIIVVNSFKKDAYSQQDFINLQSLASYISISIDNANAYQTLNQQKEKLLILDQFKESMTGMIVHDLKNPLNAILGLSSMNEEDEIMQMINSAGNQMLNLVLNILDVQKFEDSAVKLNLSIAPLSEIVNTSISQVALLVKQKNQSIILNIPSECRVDVDVEIIVRVFVNILTNAIKYTQTGGKIKIGTKQNPENPNQVIAYISDTGQGIPADKLHLVFEKFGQVEAKKSGGVRSTGLGLTFCKLVVEAHQGQIWVESEVGVGTTFLFHLPSKSLTSYSMTNEETTMEDVSVSPNNGTYFIARKIESGKITMEYACSESNLKIINEQRDQFCVILISDDDEFCQVNIETCITSLVEKMILVYTNNGKDAVEVCKQIIPHIILMDWQMPVMDGIEAIILIKSDELTQKIPILMVTSRESEKDLKRAFEAGAMDYIKKPFEKDIFVQRVKTMLQFSFVMNKRIE